MQAIHRCFSPKASDPHPGLPQASEDKHEACRITVDCQKLTVLLTGPPTELEWYRGIGYCSVLLLFPIPPRLMEESLMEAAWHSLV